MPSAFQSQGFFPPVSLDAAGLVALADLSTIARRTALTGNSSLLDIFVLAPGLHRQQNAPDLNGGEYPACAAMTSGYVFRVENPATVLYLQKVGRTGHLTTLKVSGARNQSWWKRLAASFYDTERSRPVATLAYATAVFLTLAMLFFLVFVWRDWWGFGVINILILSRALNVFVVRCRSRPGWFGAPEPGIQSDLLVLLSQDRWIRLQGLTDDIKAVTSGQWLQEPTFFQSSLVALATLLVYLDAALAGNAQQMSKLCLLFLLFGSVALLGIANETTDVLKMHGRLIEVVKSPKRYARRLHLAEELIRETGRKDWAIRLGMIQPDYEVKTEKDLDGPPTM